MEHCDDHSGQCARMDRAERDIQTIFNEVNGMKKMVITAMGGVIIQVVVFIGGVILMMMQRGHS